MDIQYVGEGRPADKRITFHNEQTHMDQTIVLKFKSVKFKNADNVWLVIDVPNEAGVRLLVSPNFKEFKGEKGHIGAVSTALEITRKLKGGKP